MTRRAVVTGLIAAVLINLWAQFMEFAARSSLITLAHLPIAAILPLFVLTAVVNPLLGLVRPGTRFTTPELFLIFACILVASSVPGFGFVFHFLRVISTPYYFVSSENRWHEVFFGHLPDWLVVPNPSNALTWFFEGLPQNQAIPWEIWIIPMFWWMTFVGALFLCGACMVVLIRKQWIDYERLSFPLAQIPLAMIQTDRERLIPPYLRNRLFWIGFAIPLTIIGWNIIDYFTDVGPLRIGTPYSHHVVFAREFPPLILQLNYLVLATAFFANLNVLFSTWIFVLVQTVQTGLLNRIGLLRISGSLNLNDLPLVHYFGGFVVFILWGLWVARHHLLAVFSHIFRRSRKLDDRNELISYRAAFWGMSLTLFYAVAWLYSAGMTLPVIASFLAALFILYIGIARIVAETGLVYMDLPINANEFTVAVWGTSEIPLASLTNLGLANVYARNWRLFSMTALSHLIYMGGRTIKNGRIRLLGLMLATLLVSLVAAVGFTVYMGYNPHQAPAFRGMSQLLSPVYIDIIATWVQNKTVVSQMEKLSFGLGAVVMSLLIALQFYVTWWPLHPVGFALGGVLLIKGHVLSIFMAWLIKGILIRTGGVQAYRKAQPVFIGLLAGYAVAVGLSFAVDAIWFPGQGHRIHY